MSPWSFRIAAASLAAAAMVSPALAQDPQAAEAPEIVVTGKASDKDVVTRAVNIGDLNLATDEGVAEMQKRVASAVDDICAIPAVVGYYRDKAEKPCRDEGWASATPQMDAALKKAREGSGG
jgi:UrcA family protein